MYSVVTPERFLRRAARFFRKHRALEPRFRALVTSLRDDPFQPRLRIHPLRGRMDGLHAISLTYQYRVILTVQITEREVILIDIGTHDEVYD
jgi:mRNA-degrading endonuclease YafQ of YafQ-DinJ toxin-antitoxin module